jgi:hypothetical protein
MMLAMRTVWLNLRGHELMKRCPGKIAVPLLKHGQKRIDRRIMQPCCSLRFRCIAYTEKILECLGRIILLLCRNLWQGIAWAMTSFQLSHKVSEASVVDLCLRDQCLIRSSVIQVYLDLLSIGSAGGNGHCIVGRRHSVFVQLVLLLDPSLQRRDEWRNHIKTVVLYCVLPTDFSAAILLPLEGR